MTYWPGLLSALLSPQLPQQAPVPLEGGLRPAPASILQAGPQAPALRPLPLEGWPAACSSDPVGSTAGAGGAAALPVGPSGLRCTCRCRTTRSLVYAPASQARRISPAPNPGATDQRQLLSLQATGSSDPHAAKAANALTLILPGSCGQTLPHKGSPKLPTSKARSPPRTLSTSLAIARPSAGACSGDNGQEVHLSMASR